jgi:membrane peptidoglycan carboxypeptidase
MLMAQAAIAAEDARFPEHPGYDIEGINLALQALSSGEERPRGGSTITQQLAKNLFLSGERTLARKARELLYALELERVLGKSRILELYINVVEFGPELYGVRGAADVYFLKQPQGLAPQEAAFLSAILPSPRSWHSRVSRGASPPTATVHRILANMANTGALDASTARWAQREPLVIIPPVYPQ